MLSVIRRMTVLELLPADKRDAILTELLDTDPQTDVVLLKDWMARRIGPRTMRRLMDAELGIEQRDAQIERLRAELEAIRTVDAEQQFNLWSRNDV